MGDHSGALTHLATLTQTAGKLAEATVQADRQQQASTLAGLVREDRGDASQPEIRLLNKAHWSWRLELVKTSEGRFLFWGHSDQRSILQVAIDVWISPVPREAGPSTVPPPPEILLERPSVLLPSTDENLRHFVPTRYADSGHTVLLDIGANNVLGGDVSGDDVLAVWRPEALLGALHAKLWLGGQRMKPSGGRWPAAPFMGLVQRVGDWLASKDFSAPIPLNPNSDDDLVQVVGEIVRSRHQVLASLGQAAAASKPSYLGHLQADHVLSKMTADLRLRLDTAGDLSDDEDTKTVTLAAVLRFDDPPEGLREGATPRAYLSLEPPDFLATGEVLEGLLSALKHDAQHWQWRRQGLEKATLVHVLDLAAGHTRGTVAFRVRRRRDKERWILFLPSDASRSRWFVLRAVFERGPQRQEAHQARIPGKVEGAREVLHHPEKTTQQRTFDDDVVRAFLKLITALHRYGQALF